MFLGLMSEKEQQEGCPLEFHFEMSEVQATEMMEMIKREGWSLVAKYDVGSNEFIPDVRYTLEDARCEIALRKVNVKETSRRMWGSINTLAA